jgi:hypothetical protein
MRKNTDSGNRRPGPGFPTGHTALLILSTCSSDLGTDSTLSEESRGVVYPGGKPKQDATIFEDGGLFSGVIITDWFTPPESPGERFNQHKKRAIHWIALILHSENFRLEAQ